MTAPEDRLAALGALARHRRLALGMTINQAADAAGVVKGTWIRFEKGEAIRGASYLGAESALGYVDGAFERFINGGDEPALRRPSNNLPETRAERAQTLIRTAQTDPAFKKEPRLAQALIDVAKQVLKEEGFTEEPSRHVSNNAG